MKFKDARYRVVVSESGTALLTPVGMLDSIGKDRPITDMLVGHQNGDVSVHA